MIIYDIVVEHTRFNILQLLQNKKKSVKFTFCFIVSSNATRLEIKSIFWCMQRSIIHRKLWFIYLMGTVKYLLRVACLKDDDMKIFIFASATTQTLLCFQWAFSFSSVCVQHKALDYNNQYVFTCTLKHVEHVQCSRSKISYTTNVSADISVTLMV